MYYYTCSGRIKLSITLKDAKSGCHQGNCTEDIKRLAKKPYIRRQLEKLETEILAEELLEQGAWEEEVLEDNEDNKERILWIACCEIREEYS